MTDQKSKGIDNGAGSESDNFQIWNHLEVAQVGCGYAIAQFESSDTDQQVRDRQTNTFGFVFAIQLACAQCNRNRHGMNWHGEQQIVEKPLVADAPLRRVGTRDAVGEFKNGDD